MLFITQLWNRREDSPRYLSPVLTALHPMKAFPLVSDGWPKGKKLLKVLGWKEVEEKRREHPRTETAVTWKVSCFRLSYFSFCYLEEEERVLSMLLLHQKPRGNICITVIKLHRRNMHLGRAEVFHLQPPELEMDFGKCGTIPSSVIRSNLYIAIKNTQQNHIF